MTHPKIPVKPVVQLRPRKGTVSYMDEPATRDDLDTIDALNDLTSRRFILRRHTDPGGTSGVGTVAEGCRFSDGTAVVRWMPVPTDSDAYKRGVRQTTVVFESTDAVIALHGHNGATELIWMD